jgi:16S rRNA (cytosine967-C5)-methyltransferase
MSKNKADVIKKIAKPHNARQVALLVLTRIEQEQAFSNLLLNDILRQAALVKADAGLATELVYGTLQRQNTLDFLLQPFVSKGVHKLDDWVRSLLRMSVYQLYFLDKIPARAAINEAVELAKKLGHTGISGMVNGVLRNVVRAMPEGEARVQVPANLPVAERLAIEHAHPAWLVEQWLSQFGEETTRAICESNNHVPASSARVNRLKQTRAAFIQKGTALGYHIAPSPLSEDGIVVSQAGHLAASEWFKQGEITIQDESSMVVAKAVAAEPGMHVLDCCAAPGGKSTHIAETMQNQGKLIANDIHEHKARLILNHATRLGLTCIQTSVSDAARLTEKFEPNSFDRILLDAPCSGFGVIRRKPEIKWQKIGADSHALAAIQTELLEKVSRLLKPGGYLVYSTCTIASEENEQVVQSFLAKHDNFALDHTWLSTLPKSVQQKCVHGGMLQLLPHHFESDGFFIARLVKK